MTKRQLNAGWVNGKSQRAALKDRPFLRQLASCVRPPTEQAAGRAAGVGGPEGGAWPRGRGVFCSVPQRLLLAASAPTGPSSGRCLGHGLLCCGASAAAGASSAQCLGRGGGDKKPRSLMSLFSILAPELAYAGKG